MYFELDSTKFSRRPVAAAVDTKFSTVNLSNLVFLKKAAK
eukprot:SAG31_NODE_806_length_11957_cov_2.232670_18_plen_40_part_00